MSSPEPLSAIERARWLEELARAVEQSSKLALELGGSEDKRYEAQELHAQLEAIRIELEMLRHGRPGDKRVDIDPKWIDLLGWHDGRPG